MLDLLYFITIVPCYKDIKQIFSASLESFNEHKFFIQPPLYKVKLPLFTAMWKGHWWGVGPPTSKKGTYYLHTP